MHAEVYAGDYQTVSQLKFIRDQAKQANLNQRNILTNIGMLASSGINSHHVIRIVPMLLRKFMHIDIAGFFWANQDGDMIDAYVETPSFLSANLLASCLKFQNESKLNWPSFKENVNAGSSAGNLQIFQNDCFYESEHYKNTYEPINIRHIIDVVVHDGARPYGAFLFMRADNKGKFSKEETEILKVASKLLSSAFRLPIQNNIPTKRTYDLGLVLVDKALNRRFCNLTAHQILWMMTRTSELPMQFDTDDQIDSLIKKSCLHGIQQAFKNGTYTESKNCYWGEFLIKYQFDQESETVAVNLQQMQPYPCHLAIKLNQENLTPTRLMITWLLLKGCVRKEISRKLAIGEHTVAEHIQDIFKYFSISSTNDLILKIYR
ncbi:MAG: helix-turn-helix transcriptional regulator [Pseudomonadota bacterium]